MADPTERSDEDPALPVTGRRRVDKVVGTYLAVAVLWIVLSSVLAEDIADAIALPVSVIEIGKGLAFVLVTGMVLRTSLRRWAGWIESAAEAETQAARDLREVTRLRSQFLQSVSHELRTPLTSIVGYAATIGRHGGELSPERLVDVGQRLLSNAQRLEALVLDLLDVERLMRIDEEMLREPLRVDLLVRRAADRAGTAEQVLEVVVEEGMVADLDRVKARRIVDELIRNAVKHTPRGTRIQVLASIEGDFLRLHVADDGPGIDPLIRDEIFEPFTQGPSSGESHSPGVGIGLTLVRRYVELHGGTVSIDSVPGQGTRCDVRLPRSAPAT